MPEDFDFDVAVSFAGEDRNYVTTVVDKLKDQQVSVFYDQDFESDMWGENLTDYLHEVYKRRARFALVFISRHYVTRRWTRLERRSAQDRALDQEAAYLLPLRLDDTELPGLPSTVGYLDARQRSVAEIADAVLGKLGAARRSATPRFNGTVPRTPAELAVLLAERPDGWEYLLYAAILHQEVNALESKYRDHLVGYARRNGRYLRVEEAAETIERNMSLYLGLSESFNRVLGARAQDAAFGLPGEAGDPDRIIHLARRFVSVYEEFMDIAAELRGTTVASQAFRRILDVEARYADLPVERIRGFVDQYVREADTFSERLERGEPIALTMVVKLEIGDEVTQEHDLAIKDFEREIGRAGT